VVPAADPVFKWIEQGSVVRAASGENVRENLRENFREA